MTRNLKRMGIAFVAVFALSAIVASAAQAKFDTFRTHTGGSVILTAEQLTNHTFEVGLATVTCKKVKLGGGQNKHKCGQNDRNHSPPRIRRMRTPATGQSHGDHGPAATTCSQPKQRPKAWLKSMLSAIAGNNIVISAAGCTITVGEQTIAQRGQLHEQRHDTQ